MPRRTKIDNGGGYLSYDLHWTRGELCVRHPAGRLAQIRLGAAPSFGQTPRRTPEQTPLYAVVRVVLEWS